MKLRLTTAKAKKIVLGFSDTDVTTLALDRATKRLADALRNMLGPATYPQIVAARAALAECEVTGPKDQNA